MENWAIGDMSICCCSTIGFSPRQCWFWTSFAVQFFFVEKSSCSEEKRGLYSITLSSLRPGNYIGLRLSCYRQGVAEKEGNANNINDRRKVHR